MRIFFTPHFSKCSSKQHNNTCWADTCSILKGQKRTGFEYGTKAQSIFLVGANPLRILYVLFILAHYCSSYKFPCNNSDELIDCNLYNPLSHFQIKEEINLKFSAKKADFFRLFLCAWRKVGTKDEQGTQIDLLIERADRVINICEMKFSDSAYSITKDYENKLRTKLSVFREETRTTKSILLTMVTTYGITMGIHSGIITNEVCMNDLFEKAY